MPGVQPPTWHFQALDATLGPYGPKRSISCHFDDISDCSHPPIETCAFSHGGCAVAVCIVRTDHAGGLALTAPRSLRALMLAAPCSEGVDLSGTRNPSMNKFSMLKRAVAVVALASSLSAQAGLTKMETDNSSLMFVAIGTGPMISVTPHAKTPRKKRRKKRKAERKEKQKEEKEENYHNLIKNIKSKTSLP